MANAALLQKIPLFKDLTKDQREFIAASMSVREVAHLENVFWVGDPGDEMYVIESGQVEISIPDTGGQEIRLAVLEAGDFLGEISVLDSGPRTATARVLKAAKLLVLRREDFNNCMIRFPTVAMKVIEILSQRQRGMVEKLRGIRNLNEVLEQHKTRWQQLADKIAKLAASEPFLITHLVIFGSWILLNLVLPRSIKLDPFPFPFLCFWLSLEAIFLSMFILISQGQQAAKDRLRNEVEYQIAVKVQFEMMQLHRKLDEQAEVLAKLQQTP